MLKGLWAKVNLSYERELGIRYFHRVNKTERRVIMMDKFGPPVNRAMRELDRSFFKKDVELLVAYFPNPKFLGDFVKSCKKDILFLPSIKHIVPVKDSKGVLLRAEIDNINNYTDRITDLTRSKLEEYSSEVLPYTMHLDYNFWKADDILRAVLPEDLLDEIPTGFAQAGHVAHLNLREEFKPYGKLIGDVILDKNSKVETVVDKLDTIDTKFRTFQMKVIAGKEDLLVEQNESGCKFKFDFSKVYWNSRLSTEHERLIREFQPEKAVADVFAGVGPFVVPAGKKKVFVLANDLNPESYKYLKENITSNRTDDFVKAYNLDGRDFIKQSPKLLLEWSKDAKFVEQHVTKRRKVKDGEKSKTTIDKEVNKIFIPKLISNYVMNLPDTALTFLDAFIGLYADVESDIKGIPNFELPVINVHCFEKYSQHEEPSLDELHRRIHQKIVKYIDYEISIDDCDFHLVRRVAPKKPMFCASFKLPHEVAFRKS